MYPKGDIWTHSNIRTEPNWKSCTALWHVEVLSAVECALTNHSHSNRTDMTLQIGFLHGNRCLCQQGVKDTGREATSPARPLEVTYRPGYTGVDKHKEKSFKRKTHEVESAKNGAWVAREGWVRKRSARKKGNHIRKKMKSSILC